MSYPKDFYTEDPYNATAPQDTDRWANDGQGLSLEVLNALESNWYSYFDAAILDWSSGSPSTLNLTTAVIPHESDCWPVTGKLKVCNGNYGATKWRGINQALIEDGFIVSSSAKMNEYYLSQASNDRKQYTMCHEIGHGKLDRENRSQREPFTGPLTFHSASLSIDRIRFAAYRRKLLEP